MNVDARKFEQTLNQAKILAIKLLKKEISDRENFPETQGVYLIRKSNEIIYVGQGKNLKRRINSDHVSGDRDGSTSTFRVKVHRKYNVPFGKIMRNWVIKNCRFSYIEIKNADLTSLVESLLIIVLRKSGVDLLNK